MSVVYTVKRTLLSALLLGLILSSGSAWGVVVEYQNGNLPLPGYSHEGADLKEGGGGGSFIIPGTMYSGYDGAGGQSLRLRSALAYDLTGIPAGSTMSFLYTCVEWLPSGRIDQRLCTLPNPLSTYSHRV